MIVRNASVSVSIAGGRGSEGLSVRASGINGDEPRLRQCYSNHSHLGIRLPPLVGSNSTTATKTEMFVSVTVYVLTQLCISSSHPPPASRFAHGERRQRIESED